MAGGGDSIKVAIRVRPFNQRELGELGGGQLAYHIIPPKTIDTGQPRTYDHVLSGDPSWPCYGTQKDVYDNVGAPLLENALQSYNGCIFAYGQTGAGKSFSVLGDPTDEEQKGILPRACERLFQALADEKEENCGMFTYDVLATYLDIYNEKIGDLLALNNTRDLQVRLHPLLGPHVPGLTETKVTSYNDVDELLNFGSKNRVVAATQMNAQSSRSHAIFSIDIRMTRGGKDSQARVHFVDLAGSERQKKTGAQGDRLKEGIGINKSLSVLGKIISTLTGGKKGEVPPFRESKLTLLLKEALNGNSKTILIACVSPATFNLEETKSTLEFASRCKMISTSAKQNEVDRKDLVEALEQEKKLIEAKLQREQQERGRVVEMVEKEKERAAALQEEMTALQEELAKTRLESAAAEQAKIDEERLKAQTELNEAKRRMSMDKAMNQKEKEEAVAKLQAEMQRNEDMRKEREAVLEQLTNAEKERSRLNAEQERIQQELREERERMAQTQESSRHQMEEAVRKLEAEQAEKERLAEERARALEKLAKEQEDQQAALQAELANAKRRLSMTAATSQQEKNEALAKMQEERKRNEEIQQERQLALKKLADVEQEREGIKAEQNRIQEELIAEKARLAQAQESSREEIERTVKRLESEHREKEKLALERAQALEALEKEHAETEALRLKASQDADRLRIEREEWEKKQSELEQAKQQLEMTTTMNEKEKQAALEQLQAEMKVNEEIRHERELALQKLADVEREREGIRAEQDRIQQELIEERARLAQAQESSRHEIEETVKRLEAEHTEKQTLARERAQALEALEKEQAEKEALRLKSAEEAERRRIERQEWEQTQAELEKAKQQLEMTTTMNEKEKQATLDQLQAEMRRNEEIRKEREEALEKIKQAEIERHRIIDEQERTKQELQKERDRLAQAKESSQQEIMAARKRLEEEEATKQALAKEKAEALDAIQREQAEKEALLQKSLEEAEKLRSEQQRTAEKEEELQTERLARSAAEQEMMARLKAMELEKENKFRQAEAYEKKLKECIEEEKLKEKQMQEEKAYLQSLVENLNASRTESDKKAQEQREARQKALEELGFGAAGLTEEEREVCPRLFNLNADPSLSRNLMFYVPPQSVSGNADFTLGADAQLCQIRLEGLGIGPQMCVLRNIDNKKIFVAPKNGGRIRVNGVMVEEGGRDLEHGDRLAIGQAYIFGLEVPLARQDDKGTSKAKAEAAFEHAMNELDACADIDPRWKNGVNSAMHLVKREFGTSEANALLKAASTASEELKKANTMLDELPPEWRNGIKSYELAVLFDSGGLPIITVVARRDLAVQDDGMRCEGIDTDSVWTMKHFIDVRLPWMEEVYEEWQALSGSHNEHLVAREDWQALVWGDTFHLMAFTRDALEKEAMEAEQREEEELRRANGFIGSAPEIEKPEDKSLLSRVFGDWSFGGIFGAAPQPQIVEKVSHAAEKFKKKLATPPIDAAQPAKLSTKADYLDEPGRFQPKKSVAHAKLTPGASKFGDVANQARSKSAHGGQKKSVAPHTITRDHRRATTKSPRPPAVHAEDAAEPTKPTAPSPRPSTAAPARPSILAPSGKPAKSRHRESTRKASSADLLSKPDDVKPNGEDEKSGKQTKKQTKMCQNGCGRPAFEPYPTCCTHCKSPDGPHAEDCAQKSAKKSSKTEERRKSDEIGVKTKARSSKIMSEVTNPDMTSEDLITVEEHAELRSVPESPHSPAISGLDRE